MEHLQRHLWWRSEVKVTTVHGQCEQEPGPEPVYGERRTDRALQHTELCKYVIILDVVVEYCILQSFSVKLSLSNAESSAST